MNQQFHDIRRPARTMWRAARDLLERGCALRCAATWNAGYRLWIQAAASRAPGEQFTLAEYVREWLPTPPLDRVS